MKTACKLLQLSESYIQRRDPTGNFKANVLQLDPVQERDQLGFFRIRYLGIPRSSERISEIFGFKASLHFDHISVNMPNFETFDTGLESL